MLINFFLFKILFVIFFNEINGWVNTKYLKIKNIFPINFKLYKKIFFIKRPYKIVIKNITTTSVSDKVVVKSYISKDSGSFSVNFKILEDIPIVLADFEVNLQTQKSVYDMHVISRTIDFCKFFENRNSDPLLNIVYDTVLSFGVLPQNCPIKAVCI